MQEISPAAGSEFSVLPADNATGNFVKIAQRIPVKVSIDRGQEAAARLRPGMSVVVGHRHLAAGRDDRPLSALAALASCGDEPTSPTIRWQALHFRELDLDTLYALLKLRSEVFVVEQNCVYLDPDGKDRHPETVHLLGLATTASSPPTCASCRRD